MYSVFVHKSFFVIHAMQRSLPDKLRSSCDVENKGAHDNRRYRDTEEYDCVFSGIVEKKFGHDTINRDY